MSYGQNQSAGLVPIRSLTGAWSGQMERYFIRSTYPNNIFTGDLVYLGADGFLHNLSDLQVANYPTAPAIGVFMGCFFTAPSASQGGIPSNFRQFWPGGTIVTNSPGAYAQVLVDPNIIYNIQGDGSQINSGVGISWADVGSNMSVGYTYVAGSNENPTGNLNNGQSSLVAVGGTTGTSADLNLAVLGFVQDPRNNIPLPGAGAAQYVNIEAMIQNHRLAKRAPGL